MSGPP